MSSALITRGQPPKLASRKPTGKPTWPMLLLAGAEKTGKSYNSAVLSASPMVGRTFYVEVGEGAIDAYGAIPGVRFEVLEHDGTFMGIARQVWAATLEPREHPDRPNVIVIDSATEVWDLLSSEQQELANVRRARRNNGNQVSADDAPITMDQWNSAKKRWRALVDLLRSHDGPVIWTARFEEVAVMGENGRPVEGKKQWKIRTEKNLPFEVDGVIEMPKPREVYLTGIRSLTLQLDSGERRPMPDFTIEGLLRQLGLHEGVGQRHYVAPSSEGYVDEYEAEQRAAQQPAERQPGQRDGHRPVAYWLREIDKLTGEEQGRALWRQINAAGQTDVDHEGISLGDRVIGKVEKLKEAAKKAPAASTPEAAPEEPKGEPSADVAANAPAADTASPAAAERPKLTEPDDAEHRRNTAQRRGVIGGIVHEFGDSQEAADAAAEQEFGLPMEQLGTKRLRDWLTNDLMRGAR